MLKPLIYKITKCTYIIVFYSILFCLFVLYFTMCCHVAVFVIHNVKHRENATIYNTVNTMNMSAAYVFTGYWYHPVQCLLVAKYHQTVVTGRS
jgi:hypothetical protein